MRVEWALLDGVPNEERERFLGIARPRSYRRGEVIFLAGAPADTLQLIVSGWVTIRAGTEAGNMALLSVRGPGDFFGDIALFNPEWSRTANVTALDVCETLSVHRDDFTRLRAVHQSVDQVLVKVLSTQVRRLSTLLVEAMYLPAEARLYRRILDAAEVWGGSVKGTVIPLTQEDIAELAGTTRSTANRALRHAEESGLLRIRRGRIELLDPTGIAHLARIV